MIRTVICAAAVLFLAPYLTAQSAQLEGGWVIVDPGTGQVLGTLEIERRPSGEVSFTGHLKSSAPGGLPPAWLGSGTLNDREGQYSWMSLDGREGRTTIRKDGDRLRLEIRCQRGTCTGSEFTYAAARPTAVGTTPVVPPPVSPPSTPPPPVTTPSPAPRAWETVRSTEGGFRIDFPGAGAYAVADNFDNVTGTQYKNHTWKVVLDDGAIVFALSYADLPAARVSSLGLEGTISDAIKGGARRSNATVVSETPVIVGGYPAIDFVIVAEGNRSIRVRGRAVLVGHRLYRVMVSAWAETSRARQAEVDRFLNSFQVIR